MELGELDFGKFLNFDVDENCQREDEGEGEGRARHGPGKEEFLFHPMT